MNVDPVFVDLFRSDADVQELPDVFAKLAADGGLRGAGVEPDVLRAETSQTEKRFGAMHSAERFAQMAKAHGIHLQKTQAQREYEAEHVADGRELEKRMVGERRRNGLRQWLASELALGKSADDLIAHAERFDPEIAGVLREVAQELAAIA